MNNENNNGGNTVFNMTKIGSNISRLRRENNLTQTELADLLGISFQAVSNWERGQSMPDIAKLGDLSQIFKVSIDEILENKKSAKIIEEIARDETPENLGAEELQELAPIMKPVQLDETIAASPNLKISDLVPLAPFLSSGVLGAAARRAFESGGKLSEVAPLAPFLDESDLNELAENSMRDCADMSAVAPLLPFLGEETVGRYAIAAYKSSGDVSSVTCAAPFMSEKLMDELAAEIYEKTHDLNALSPIKPFVSDGVIDSIAERTLADHDFDPASIVSTAPFISEEKLTELAKSIIEHRGLNALRPIMPFLNEDAVEKYIMEILKKR